MAGRKLSLANTATMVFVLASMSLFITVAQDDPQTLKVGEGCSLDTYRYVNKTAFEDNLNASFASLALNISSSNTSFFATSVSNKGNTDAVYALLLCRKYLTSQECLQCFTAAENRVKQLCSNEGFNGGRIYLDGCSLRYENATFFEEGTDSGFSNYCASIYDTKPKEFNETAEILLSQLITNAYRSDGYAVGVASKASITLYGLAQCVPTLSTATCQDCLTAAQTLVNNCLPKQEGRGLNAGCFMRYATSPFFENLNSTAPTSSQKKSKTWPILLGSIGGTILLAALCSVFIWRRFKEKFKRYFRATYLYSRTEGDLTAAETFEQVIFEYDVLRDATENFDNAKLLGKGGYGEVYKGKLVDGRSIAVKKSSEKRSSKAMEDFLTEVKLISSVRHRNLVRLLGCCARGDERLLVYEFMSNNSLDKHLFGDKGNHLDWETRFNIIVGTARGLAYLHEDSNIRIVHRDIKAANILLDDKFHAKIADFGLAKFFPEGETHVSTRFAAGTIGYMAPEYAVHGQLSEKADVYSYGVLVLEIVTGRKCVNQRLPVPLQLLLEWAWTQYQRNEALEIVDERMREKEYPREQVLRVINIALLCCQASPDVRPTMSAVLSMLTTATDINAEPAQPAFTDAGVTGLRSPSSAASTSASEGAQSHGTISVSLIPR